MKHNQCLMCKFINGRSCKKYNGLIPDDIYDDLKKCDFFTSIQGKNDFEEDKCCYESKLYENYEKIFDENAKKC